MVPSDLDDLRQAVIDSVPIAFLAALVAAHEAYIAGRSVQRLPEFKFVLFDLNDVRESLKKRIETGDGDLDFVFMSFEGDIETDLHSEDDIFDLQLMPLIARQAVVMNWKRLQTPRVGKHIVKVEEITRFSLIVHSNYEAEVKLLERMCDLEIIDEYQLFQLVGEKAEYAFECANYIVKMLVELLDEIIPKKPGPKKKVFDPHSRDEETDDFQRLLKHAYDLVKLEGLSENAASLKVAILAKATGKFRGDEESLQRRLKRHLRRK